MKSESFQNYEAVAHHYDSARQIVALEQIRSLFQKHSSLTLDSILDVGCGTGNYLIALSPYFSKGTGLDVSEAMLHCFQKKIQQKKLESKLQLVKGVAWQLQLPSNSYDCVLACMLLHHLGSSQNKQKFFNEAKRVLKQGGLLILNHICDYHILSTWTQLLIERVKIANFKLNGTEESVREFGAQAGLELCSIVPVKQCVMKNYNCPPAFDESRPSSLALFTEQELEQFKTKVNKMVEEGSLQQWIQKETGQNIAKVGYSSLFVFKKGSKTQLIK